ncbi:DUF1800 family protein [Winogradskyella sp.]|uniref:DUF1800 family protein n=1 Tax=Winogradskyella sp. TaxID=1883156 RepID=UPI0025DDA206|nr:DUF1800 family protein [Winogradskyella sp.]
MPRGLFTLRKFQHDNGQKTFFGKTGNLDGDDIIDAILEKKACARFICKKVYSYFVNETIEISYVDKMTDVFYKDYDIEKLMRFVFTQSWFYDTKNIGSKNKVSNRIFGRFIKNCTCKLC